MGLTGEGLRAEPLIECDGVADLRDRVVKLRILAVFLSLVYLPLGST